MSIRSISAPPTNVEMDKLDLDDADQRDLFIRNAFQERKSGIDLIDDDFPGDKCVVFSGKSRTTTPIGEGDFVDPESLLSSIILNIEEKEEDVVTKFLKGLSTTRNWPTDDIKELALQAIKDQDGSRLIQQQVDQWNDKEIADLFKLIQDHVLELSSNLFGNYVIQKIIPRLSQNNLMLIVMLLQGNFSNLCMHIYGCRVVQKLVDHFTDVSMILSRLADIFSLITNQNGNHVIQKILDRNTNIDFIIHSFNANLVTLSTQRYGCRVLQKILEVQHDLIFDLQEESSIPIGEVLSLVVSNIKDLINDKYGNYVIQHILSNFSSRNYYKKIIVDYIIENAYDLSKYKFSSNVIETCIKNTEEYAHSKFFTKFSEETQQKPKLFYMCIDNYANYVVQRFFTCASEPLFDQARVILKPYIKEIKTVPFTKHIVAKLLQIKETF